VTHWSTWSLNTTSATLDPFVPGEHLFYIEAEDSNGLVCLGILFFRVVRSTFENSLLFVDDTRLAPDRRSAAGVLSPPVGPWPTAAELDTFLFAKGGFPWRHYPAGTLSPPGIFNGYEYDTIGTRGLSADGTVPLSLLGKYKHVVWYVDEGAAAFDKPPFNLGAPITALRLSNTPGHPVILATYMIQGFRTHGGHVWLCGGGAAYATLVPWNRTGTPPNIYDTAEPNPELRPGRMMYDFTHWRDGIAMNPARYAEKYGIAGTGLGTDGPNRWPPGPPLPTPPLPPNYLLLPNTLDPKAPATDPPLPLRRPNSDWFRTDYRAEYINAPTFIREDYDDHPEAIKDYSTLDTLYRTFGHTAPPGSPVMTYYHGRENQPIVFSGFNFWYWTRPQCIQLVDWVLHEVWELQRNESAPRAVGAPMASRRASR
jgi:hypothetical protein